MNKPELRREGDDFLFRWKEGLEAEVRDIHQSRDGPRAEVRVSSVLQGHFHQAMLNLMSSSGRETMRRSLERRDPDVEWQALIEQVCILSVEAWRNGYPMVRPIPRLRSDEDAYLVRPLLRSGVVTLIFGDGAAGKSQLAQIAAAALSRGQGFAGMFAAGPASVAYHDWETDEDEFADRMARLGLADNEMPWYKRHWAPLPQLARQIKRECDEFEIDYCIYDSLGFAAGGELKDPDVVLQCFSAIRYIGRPGALIHHIPKETKEPYGSVYVRNAARNAWYMAKAFEDTNEFSSVLIHRKCNAGRLQDSIGLRFVFTNARTDVERTDAKPLMVEERGGSKADRILALLSEGKYTPSEIAVGLGDRDSRSVNTYLGRLLKRGLVEKGDDGRYRLCDNSAQQHPNNML